MNTRLPRFRPASHEAMEAYLRKVLPGQSTAIRSVHAQLTDFGCDQFANSLLIRGALGTGKSVLAKHAALLKSLSMMGADQARSFVDALPIGPFGDLHPLLMSWYVELALPGLVEELAASQLFGTVKGAYTGAIDRPGVFELAAQARDARILHPGAVITGGVVFLDEIGDLPSSLQPKLLTVLSKGTFYRIGGEGHQEHARKFEGIVISATWRDLEDALRPDLLSRIAGTVIRVPSVAERLADLDLIVDEMQIWVEKDLKARLDRLRGLDPDVVDRENLKQYEQGIMPVSAAARRKLAAVDWDQHGNLRGLRRAVEAAMTGMRSIEEIIADLPLVATPRPQRDLGEQLLKDLLAKPQTAGGLAAHVKEVEHDGRTALQELLKRDPAAVTELAERIGIKERDLREQAHQLSRRRTS